MLEHKVLGVSEPHSLPKSPSHHPKKSTIGQKARNCAGSVFFFIYSFYIGKEVWRVCLNDAYEYVAFRQVTSSVNLARFLKSSHAGEGNKV
jgi:hypothetical protein